jgi:regulator of replication initiation timing
MLLFSTLLEINDTMTKDSFIQLVLEWNQGSPHEENIIQGIEWHGERNIRYGTDTLWLAIEEYRNENIIAIRYEKTEADGVVWDTDYVMNFNDMKMSIQLDRSYLEEALAVDPTFSTPHFITLLIEHGYLKDDGILPMLRKPIFIKADNVDLLTDVINGTSRYRLPVVYISKTYYGEDPVDIWKLSGRLKGVAHVLVEEGTWLNGRIRRQCDDKNEFNGAIGVYFPNSAYGHKKYLYRAYDGIDAVLSEKVIRSVIQYCNAQMMDKLYTWQGVNNALLRDRLSMRGAELLAAESEKNRMAAEADELIESVDEDIQKLKKQVEELTRANEILTYENQGLRSKMSSADNMPILYLGEEEEFYQGEIREMILDAIAEKLKNLGEKTRRWDVLTDVLNANDYQNIRDERERTVKILFKDYKTLSASMRQQLLELGFEITEEGKHYRLTYYGDGRYKTTIAKTGSDWREGKNIASVILKSMM